ncbi:MAG: sigma-70 family RNA polymerase sigma factor [Planctomycetota bacterium]
MDRDLLATTTARIQRSLDRLHDLNDITHARSDLLQQAEQRIRGIVRREAAAYSYVLRWEQEDDLVQEVFLRVLRAVEDAKPRHVGQFFVIVGQHARWATISMIRKYFGPHGQASHHHTGAIASAGSYSATGESPAGEDIDPLRLHEAVDRLPENVRDAWALFAYTGQTHEQIAELLGVSAKTVQRRLNQARGSLAILLSGED